MMNGTAQSDEIISGGVTCILRIYLGDGWVTAVCDNIISRC